MNISELNELYPYSKPRPPAQLLALGLITVSGLIALFFAALHAFSLVASPAQAFFAAVVIEAGLVVEALALINKPRTIYPWVGLVISLFVSGTYNYVQASTANQTLVSIELVALAFGPLSALAVVSLTFGNELRSYQEWVSTWENDRAKWVDNERKRLERKEERRAGRSNSVQVDRSNSVQVERSEAFKGGQLDVLNAQKTLSKQQALNDVLTYLNDNPWASFNDIGQVVGRSKATAFNYVDELQQAGKLIKNGHGWVVTGREK